MGRGRLSLGGVDFTCNSPLVSKCMSPYDDPLRASCREHITLPIDAPPASVGRGYVDVLEGAENGLVAEGARRGL